MFTPTLILPPQGGGDWVGKSLPQGGGLNREIFLLREKKLVRDMWSSPDNPDTKLRRFC